MSRDDWPTVCAEACSKDGASFPGIKCLSVTCSPAVCLVFQLAGSLAVGPFFLAVGPRAPLVAAGFLFLFLPTYSESRLPRRRPLSVWPGVLARRASLPDCFFFHYLLLDRALHFFSFFAPHSPSPLPFLPLSLAVVFDHGVRETQVAESR